MTELGLPIKINGVVDLRHIVMPKDAADRLGITREHQGLSDTAWRVSGVSKEGLRR